MNKNKKSVLKSKNPEDVPAKKADVPNGDDVKPKNVLEKIKAKKEKVKKAKEAGKLATSKAPKVVEDNKPKKGASEEITEAELKKIEKKKAKKLAQKLKKAQKKAAGKDDQQKEKSKPVDVVKDAPKKDKKEKKRKVTVDQVTVEKDTTAANEDVAPKKKKNKKNKSTKDGAEEVVVEKKPSSSSTDSPKPAVTSETSERVQTKKEKKLKKRQQLKEQKLAEKSTRDPATDEATVFVGNLPVNTKRVQLIKLFKKYGPVNSIRLRSASGKLLHKHKMRKAAGSLNAYVVLKSKAAAEKSLELNGTEFKGVHLRVTKSTLKTTATSPELNDESKRTIFVGNLKYTATEESLRETFSSCGEVEYVRCIRDGEKGCKGVAYVRFKTTDAVGLALELNQTILDERPINVERYSVKKLGAKEKRDAAEANEKKNMTKQKGKGDDTKKNKKFNQNANKPTKKQSGNDEDDSKKAKKSEFRGVKVEALKKKLKAKKKKTNQVSEIVKKIAPRPKKAE